MTVKRWSVGADDPDENGNLVAYADYLSLAAENSSLRLTIDNIVNALGLGDGPVAQQVIELVNGLAAENAKLAEEVINYARECDRITYYKDNKISDAHQNDAAKDIAAAAINTDAIIAEISAKSIEKAADDLAGENNIGGHEVDSMYKYAANLRAGGKAS